jgi:hypothetical protein
VGRSAAGVAVGVAEARVSLNEPSVTVASRRTVQTIGCSVVCVAVAQAQALFAPLINNILTLPPRMMG